MKPEQVEAWRRVFRDFLIVGIGAFMLIYGTIKVKDPTILALVLGGGLTAVGLPPMLRVDEWLKSGRDQETRKP